MSSFHLAALSLVFVVSLGGCSKSNSAASAGLIFENGTYSGIALCDDSQENSVTSVQFEGQNYTYIWEFFSNNCQDLEYTMTSTGTYTATADSVTYTQSALTLTPASGEASVLQGSCTGVSLADSQPSNVAGLTCGGQSFNGNGSSYISCGTNTTTSLGVNPFGYEIAVGSGNCSNTGSVYYTLSLQP